MSNLFSETGHERSKVKEQFKSLKCILGAFMLRRTKYKLIECGNLVLPPLTEITVYVFHLHYYLAYRLFNNFLILFVSYNWKTFILIAWLHWSTCKRRFTCQYWGRNFLNYLRSLLELQIINPYIILYVSFSTFPPKHVFLVFPFMWYGSVNSLDL